MKRQGNNEETRLRVGFSRNLARDLIRRSNIKNPPVRLNHIFKSTNKDIKVNGQDLGSEDGFSVGGSLIVYNSTKPLIRQRFTVAHELGHILLGHNSGSRIIDFESKDPNEQLANIFAAELLVPRLMLKKETFSLTSLSALANRYGVSREMMSWRLRNTGFDLRLGSWN